MPHTTPNIQSFGSGFGQDASRVNAGTGSGACAPVAVTLSGTRRKNASATTLTSKMRRRVLCTMTVSVLRLKHVGAAPESLVREAPPESEVARHRVELQAQPIHVRCNESAFNMAGCVLLRFERVTHRAAHATTQDQPATSSHLSGPSQSNNERPRPFRRLYKPVRPSVNSM